MSIPPLRSPEVMSAILEGFTMIDAIKHWSQAKPDVVALRWFERAKCIETYTFLQFWTAIQVTASELEKLNIAKGERIILLFEPHLNFLVSFLACLRIGAVAVPCYAPVPGNEQRGINVFANLAQTCASQKALLSENVNKMKKWVGKWPKTINNEEFRYICLQSASPNMTMTNEPQSTMPELSDLAFLQFTSGSTGEPKGNIVGHDNFKYNVFDILAVKVVAGSTPHQKGGQPGPRDHVELTTWLPMYHDMGLSSICLTLFIGGSNNVMSPFDFLRDPLIWFDILSSTKTNFTVAPNFAYNLVNRKWDSERAKKWDFSAMSSFGNSAEPIVLSTVQDFIAHLKRDVPSIDAANCISTGYGMAEHVATIGAASYPANIIISTAQSPKPGLVVSIEDYHRFPHVRIVNPETLQKLGDGEEGEIWLQSPSVARGYWGQPQLTEETFRNRLTGEEGHWLRTGDLGFTEAGNLFVSGRLKDLIIINGRNYWPQDIEFAVNSAHPAIRPGCVAAFAVSIAATETEGFVVIAELRQSYLNEHGTGSVLPHVIPAIEGAIRMAVSMNPVEIVLIKERSVPKTTSGKIRRKESKRQWEAKELKVILSQESHGATTGVDYVTQLQWVDALVSSIVAAAGTVGAAATSSRQDAESAESVVAALQGYCRGVLTRFALPHPHLRLAEQGLDSLRAAELTSLLGEQGKDKPYSDALMAEAAWCTAPVLVEDVNALFEWTGEELVHALCGQLPDNEKRRAEQSVPAAPNNAVSDAQRAPPLDEKLLRNSFSIAKQVFFDLMGISALLLSTVLAVLPSVYFFQSMKSEASPLGLWEINTDDKPYWVSPGVVLILFAPIFFLSFTCIWLLQKWLIWGVYRPSFVPMNSLNYYRWWYIDRLTSLWEVIVFGFIAETPFANIAYWLAGGFNISMTATLCSPIRCPDLVSIGAYSDVSGFVFSQLLLPHGVSMAPISIGSNCSVRTASVMHRGAVLEDHVRLDPLSVVSAYTTCTAGYVWSGNLCVRQGEPRPAPAPVNATMFWVDRIWRVTVLFTVVYGSVVSLALTQRFWFLIFPHQPPSSRVELFWLSVWQYWGAGVFWSIITLCLKWSYFGRALAGAYKPSPFESAMRWTLSFYHDLAVKLFWSNFELSIVQLWSRMLGVSIGSGVTVTNPFLPVHPADADLLVIGDNARISWAQFQPYDAIAGVRAAIVIDEAAEVGLRSVIGAGAHLEAESAVGARVYVQPQTVVAARSVVNGTNKRGYLKRAKSKQQLSETTQLSVPTGPLWLTLLALLEASGAVAPAALILWPAYLVYRELCTVAVLDDNRWLVLFITLWAAVWCTLFVHLLLHRLWSVAHSCSTSRTAKMLTIILWRWIFQVKFTFLRAVGPLWAGSILQNVSLIAAGSECALSAKVFQYHFSDYSLLKIGEFAAVADGAFIAGHMLVENELRFSTATCKDFACMYPLSLIFEGQAVGKFSQLGSHVTLTTDVPDGFLREGGLLTAVPIAKTDAYSEIELHEREDNRV